LPFAGLLRSTPERPAAPATVFAVALAFVLRFAIAIGFLGLPRSHARAPIWPARFIAFATIWLEAFALKVSTLRPVARL
jgi:hypothetical protein